jgi:flavin-binding protein dodecin
MTEETDETEMVTREKMKKYKAATEAIQEAAEATEDDELSAKLVEKRKEIADAALENFGTRFLKADL